MINSFYLGAAGTATKQIKPIGTVIETETTEFKSGEVKIKSVIEDAIDEINAGVHSFSGADTVVIIDGKVNGNLQSISISQMSPLWLNNINKEKYVDGDLIAKYPITITAEFVILNGNTVKELKASTIGIVYGSGKLSAYRIIKGVNSICVNNNISIDALGLSEQHIMCAESITPIIPNKKYGFIELIEKIRNGEEI